MVIDQTTEECIIEFRERRIDVTKIKNLKLARVFRERVHNGERFLFNYGDGEKRHSDYTDTHREYSEHSERYGDRHQDHSERYREYSDHRDRGCWGADT